MLQKITRYVDSICEESNTPSALNHTIFRLKNSRLKRGIWGNLRRNKNARKVGKIPLEVSRFMDKLGLWRTGEVS